MSRWRLLERKKAAALKANQQLTVSSNAPNNASDNSSTSSSTNVHANAVPSPSHPIQTSPTMSRLTSSPTQAPHLFPLVSDTVRPPGSYSQHNPDFDIWPPYYPPESYPIPGSSLSPSHPFRVPSPEIVSVSPAPFHFTSSSLSAALSAPPQLHRPLPSISSEPPLIEPCPETELLSDNTLNIDGHDYDHPMSLDDPLAAMTSGPNTTDHFLLPPASTSSPLLQPSIALNVHNSSIFIPHSPTHFHPLHDLWKSPAGTLSDLLAPLFENSPRSNLDNILLTDPALEDLSSVASTPFSVAPSVSPVSSPNVLSPVGLPGSDQLTNPTCSLLFSTPLEPTRSPVSSTQGHGSSFVTKRLSKSSTPMRLSSSLPLTAE